MDKPPVPWYNGREMERKDGAGMTVTYIGHSGFLVETGSCYYLFDYFQGPLPPLNRDKPVIVLSSHSHHDHYNPAVFSMLTRQGVGQIFPVLSSDIPPRNRPEHLRCRVVSPGETCILPQGQTLKAYRSTDLGVAFCIRDGEDRIYHAGDLNDWVWQGEPEADNRRMTLEYRRELDRLAQDLAGQTLTAAFVVLDPRQEEDYARGLRYFLDRVAAERVYPMHFWEQPQVVRRFLEEYPQYAGRIVPPDSWNIVR